MQLILSSGNPWNANYCNESGQALFKSSAPGFCFFGRVITLSRVVPASTTSWQKKSFSDVETLVDGDDNLLRDSYEFVGQVDYHVFKNSRIRYRDGESQSVTQFFRKGGFGVYGRNRTFTGTDGREYLWKMTSSSCKLYLNDASKTPVAVFNHKRLGIFGPSRPATLDISPGFENMIELIILTFLYMEKLRQEREDARNRGASGGGP